MLTPFVNDLFWPTWDEKGVCCNEIRELAGRPMEKVIADVIFSLLYTYDWPLSKAFFTHS